MTQIWDEPALHDYKVLGVGAVRRQQLLADSSRHSLVLYPELVPAHQQGIYDAILEESLAWLKPQKVRTEKLPTSPEQFLQQSLVEELRQEFPQTAELLKVDLQKTVNDYLREFPWQGPLLTEHFRYFPTFLQRRFQDSRLYWVSQKEWLWSYLSFADFGLPRQEEGRILVNPSLQSLYTTSEVFEVQLTEGLTIFYYDYALKKVRAYKPDIYDAAVVDALQEDRKYSLDQLIEQVLLTDLGLPLSKEAWIKKLFYLKGEGILLESGSKWISNQK